MKAKQTINILLYLILFIINLACQDNYITDQAKSSEYLDFNFKYSETNESTRAELDKNGSGFFQKGDQIGLYAFDSRPGGVSKHFKLTYDGNNWLPKFTTSDLGADNALIILSAYYPYDASIEHEFTDYYHHHCSVMSDQREKVNYEQSDLLWSNEKVISSTTSGRIDFNFTHKLFRVNIDLSGINKPDLNVKVFGGVKSDLNFYGWNIVFNPSEANSNGWVVPYRYSDSDNLYSAILIPQINPYIEVVKDLKIELTYTDTDGNQKIKIHNVDPKKLANMDSGQEVTIRLSTKEDNVVDSKYANRKIWLHGVNSPAYPENPWITLSESGVGKLAYKEGFGWFDCNKRHYIDNRTADEYQCWVAAAANMIHWWLYNNEPYSRQYVDWYNKNNNVKFPDYQFEPLTYSGGGSAIHDYISSSFMDAGGFAHDAVNWFFSDLRPSKPGPANKKGGFLKDIFPSGISTYVAGMSKDRFNQYIKQAIEQKQSIAYSIPGHVQNIWGVEFDEYGNVAYAYIVDNNYSDIDAEQYGGASISRREVIYKPEDGSFQTYIATRPVSRLALLSLQTEEFIDFINKNCK